MLPNLFGSKYISQGKKSYSLQGRYRTKQSARDRATALKHRGVIKKYKIVKKNGVYLLYIH